MAMLPTDLTPKTTQKIQTRFRKICSDIPVPESLDLIRELRKVEPQSMSGMVPIIWHQAQGFLVRDPYGNQWIDLSSGIVMANTGHAHPVIIQSIQKQLDSPLLFTYAYPSQIRCQLLGRLLKFAPPELNKALLFSSGTEANECAISLMRRNGLQIASQKRGIVSLEGNYHGRTLAAKASGGSSTLVDGISRQELHHFQLPNPNSLTFDAALDSAGIDPDFIAGVILESIPGMTTIPHPIEYMKALRTWTNKHQILLAVDEIQCGIGRTGKMFAFQHYDIIPDLITCGKGLSSSLPISAVIGAKEVMDLAPPGEMSSTFGGNPICAAAAEANLRILEEDGLIKRASTLEQYLRKWVAPLIKKHHRFISQADGRGLFFSLHLRNPQTGQPWVELADKIALECVRQGVLLFLTGRGFIKIVPPLIINQEAFKEAVDVIINVLDEELAKCTNH